MQVRRSGNEDMNLAMRADDEDYFNAEFVRTYKHSNFPGYELLKRLEERCGKCSKKNRIQRKNYSMCGRESQTRTAAGRSFL